MKKKDYLPLGTMTTERRINGETVRAVIAAGPIEHLLPIGEFYMLGKAALDKPQRGRHRGPMSRAERAEAARAGLMGMYERSELKEVGGK